MIQRTATQTIGFAAPPMEIVGALKVAEKDLAIRGGLILAARLLSALVAVGAVSCLGPLADILSGFLSPGWWVPAGRWIVAAFILGVTARRLHQFAETTDTATRQAHEAYNTYIEEWQDAALEAYKGAQGRVETRSYTEMDLRTSSPKDFVAAAVAVLLAAQRGEKAWTVDRLQRGLELYDPGGATFIGRMTEDEALAFAQALAGARVIEGRRPKVAGQLADADPWALLERVAKAARLAGGRAIKAVEEE